MTDRRAFLSTVAASLLAAPLAAEAQTAGKVARVGILSVDAPEQAARSPFLAALRDLHWIPGQNIILEGRYTAGQTDRLPAAAEELVREELVRLKVVLIVTFLNQETLAAKQATASIPIVMVLGVYPVESGLVSSLALEATVMLGQILITAGTFLVLIALFADLFMVRFAAFSWMQWVGVVIGALVILAGVYLWSNGKVPP